MLNFELEYKYNTGLQTINIRIRKNLIQEFKFPPTFEDHKFAGMKE